MSAEEYRKVLVEMPEVLSTFVEKEAAFLERIGVERPHSEIFVDSILLFHNLIQLTANDITVYVSGVANVSGFSASEELKQLRFERLEAYEVHIPEHLYEAFNDLRKLTTCATDEDVILASLCCFRWMLGFIRSRGNVFVRYTEEGEVLEDVYRVPLLELYKPHVLH